MKKFAILLLALGVGLVACGWLFLSRCNVQGQVEGQAEGKSAYVFGSVGGHIDGNIIKLVTGSAAYLVQDGTNEIWVANTESRNKVRFEPVVNGHVIDSRVTRITVGATNS